MTATPQKKSLLWCLRERLIVISAMVAFIGCYQWIYIQWLEPRLSYFGFTYYSSPFRYTLFAWAMALLPAFWMPLTLKRPTQYLYWIIYLVVFVPSMFGPLFMALRPRGEIVEFMIAMQIGMALIGSCYLIPLSRLRFRPVSPALFWVSVLLVVAAFDLWVVASFAGKMKLVSFQDVYGLRTEAKSIMQNSLVGYAVMLLGVTFNPLLIAVGLARKRKSFVFVGAAGQILLFACTGLKSEVLSVPVTIGSYYAAKWFRTRIGLVSSATCAGAFAALMYAAHVANQGFSKVFDGILFLIMSRTFATTGMLSGQYEDFFQHHPLTYLSHAKPFNLFVNSPYQFPLGYEIGAFYKGGSAMLNENAHFWVSDGMASFGILGVVYISIFVALVFWLMDFASERHGLAFVTSWVGFLGFILANGSMITIIGSGGLGLLIVLLLIMPPVADKPCRARAETCHAPDQQHGIAAAGIA